MVNLREGIKTIRAELATVRASCGCTLAVCGRDLEGELTMSRRDVRRPLTGTKDGRLVRSRVSGDFQTARLPDPSRQSLDFARVPAACKHHPGASLDGNDIERWVDAAAAGGPRQVIVEFVPVERIWRHRVS